MTLRQSITAEQAVADTVNVLEYQVENKKQVTRTIDMRELKSGHRIFEWDVEAGMIQPAEIVETTALIGAMRSYKKYIEFKVRPNCFYAPALNAQNAEKRFKKQIKMKHPV